MNTTEYIAAKFGKEFRNRKFEIGSESGIYLPLSKVFVGGVFEHEVIRQGRSLGVQRDPNIVVNEGLNHILDVIFHAGTQINPWYLGIFEGDYTPVSTNTAADIASTSTECTAYSEATRPEYVEAAPSGQSITNSANKAVFTANAAKNIYGAFLVSASAKSATTGVLMSASRFSAFRPVGVSDQILLTYTYAIADA